jgi:hypothetical protein
LQSGAKSPFVRLSETLIYSRVKPCAIGRRYPSLSADERSRYWFRPQGADPPPLPHGQFTLLNLEPGREIFIASRYVWPTKPPSCAAGYRFRLLSDRVPTPRLLAPATLLLTVYQQLAEVRLWLVACSQSRRPLPPRIVTIPQRILTSSSRPSIVNTFPAKPRCLLSEPLNTTYMRAEMVDNKILQPLAVPAPHESPFCP